MSSNVEEQDAEPLELLSEAQKAARDADLDARLEKLKLEVNQEPIHIPHPETVKATEDLLERLAALRQEHAAATATADAFRKSIAKLPEKCSIEELKAKFKEGAAEAPETINYGDHASQYYRVHRPSVPEPWWAVLIIHGGFWREKYNISNAAIETIAPALARRGFCAIEVEYRRVGGGGGWPESCDDVDAALKHCIENVAGLSERRIVLMGHSAGGHAALMCAANAQTAPRLVVAIAPVADLVHAHEKKLSDDGEAVLNFVGAAPDLRPDLYEAACPTKSQIWSRLRSDIVLATGTEDVDVPVELTRLFYHRLDQGLAGPRLFEYREPAGCDHYSVVDAGRGFAEIWEAAEGVLRRPGMNWL